jgi:enoyl-CoA hydratase/carnithine racemase
MPPLVVLFRRMSDFVLAHAYETVNLWRDGGAARIELNRPDSMNAWNEQFGLDLRHAVESVAADDDVRAVELTGAGRGFSSGADLKDISPPRARPTCTSPSPSATTRSSPPSARCRSRSSRP